MQFITSAKQIAVKVQASSAKLWFLFHLKLLQWLSPKILQPILVKRIAEFSVFSSTPPFCCWMIIKSSTYAEISCNSSIKYESGRAVYDSRKSTMLCPRLQVYLKDNSYFWSITRKDSNKTSIRPYETSILDSVTKPSKTEDI